MPCCIDRLRFSLGIFRFVTFFFLIFRGCSVARAAIVRATARETKKWREPRGHRLGNMAEWLRRQTRNLVGTALVGSNPAVVVRSLFVRAARPTAPMPEETGATG